MPAPGKRWRFVTISTHCAWLPGDERGWRSRKHKRHSSGDYKSPPPSEEHAGLRRWVQKRAATPITIPRELRSVIGVALADYLATQGHRLLAISVSGRHAHILVELPDNMSSIRAIIGEAKRKSSRAVKQQMPGRVWAAGGDYDPVDSRVHQRNSYFYILEKQGPGAWTWTYQEAVARAAEANK